MGQHPEKQKETRIVNANKWLNYAGFLVGVVGFSAHKARLRLTMKTAG